MNKRKCVLDISGKRVGVAISNEEGEFIVKSICIQYKSMKDLKRQLGNFLKNMQVEKFLIGVPISSSADKQVALIKHIAHNLRSLLTPYFFVNENFSTMIAIMDRHKYQSGISIDEIVCRKLFDIYKDNEDLHLKTI